MSWLQNVLSYRQVSMRQKIFPVELFKKQTWSKNSNKPYALDTESSAAMTSFAAAGSCPPRAYCWRSSSRNLFHNCMSAHPMNSSPERKF